MPVRPVVANNTPLVALWGLQRLDLFRELWGRVLVPPAVREEFLAIDTQRRKAALDSSPWIRIEALSSPRRVMAFAGLDRGEAEVLALAEEKDARLVILDERKGRRYARRLGLPLTGTLGILLRAKEEGLVHSVAESIQTLQNSGIYFTQRLLVRVLDLAGEPLDRTHQEQDIP